MKVKWINVKDQLLSNPYCLSWFGPSWARLSSWLIDAKAWFWGRQSPTTAIIWRVWSQSWPVEGTHFSQRIHWRLDWQRSCNWFCAGCSQTEPKALSSSVRLFGVARLTFAVWLASRLAVWNWFLSRVACQFVTKTWPATEESYLCAVGGQYGTGYEIWKTHQTLLSSLASELRSLDLAARYTGSY